ncbi:MAG: complex I subunit 5 family protein [Halanaerobiales bacterium]|nr:complex I subunit 5 family protein [Halanaerobiales bacterium]
MGVRIIKGFIDSNFIINELNLIFFATGLLITAFTLLSAYTQIEEKRREYYFLNTIYIMSFLVVIFSKNWLLFFVAWEMVTLSTTLMLLWRGRGLAGQYFIIQFFGSGILLVVIVVAISNGYAEIGAINELWLQNLFILGFGIKSALFFFFFWLPPIHSQAPAPVSAILSGWVVKLGFIIFLRLIPGGNSLLLILGFLMIFYGGIKTLQASDYKVLLAYSSISQLGYIAIGIGSGNIYGYIGSIFQIIVHGIAKTGLFIGSGYLIREYGSRSIYDFKQIWSRQKLTALSLLICFSLLMGTPFLLGYNSKYLIKYGLKSRLDLKYINTIDLGPLITIIFLAATLLSVLYSVRFLYWALFRDCMVKKQERAIYKTKKVYFLKKTDRLNLIAVIFLILMLGLYPGLITSSIKEGHFDYGSIAGFIEFVAILFLSLVILKGLAGYKTEKSQIPSFNFLFNKINKSLYRVSRNVYNFIYQDFQYQLLCIPLFLLLLLFWLSLIK